MGENSEISWTDHTFNPWMGCQKVSPACTHCYAERDMDHRFGKVAWGTNGTRVVTSEANWRKPLRWNSIAGKSGVRPRVFCASLADVFEDWRGQIRHSSGVPMWMMHEANGQAYRWGAGHVLDDPASGRPLVMDDLRNRLFQLIDYTPHIDWLLLTKRPENIQRMWWGDTLTGFRPCHRSNVWIGTSVENQEFAAKRIPELLKCRRLSPVLFLSCEPVVGHINLPGEVACPYCEDACPDPETGVVECSICDGGGVRSDQLEFEFDWVIAGGESGPNARPADPDWFRSLRDQCKTARVPFHFKQWGEFDATQTRVGKKKAGRLLDGIIHDAFPEKCNSAT